MGAGTREGAAGGGGKRPKLAANDMQCTCKGQPPPPTRTDPPREDWKAPRRVDVGPCSTGRHGACFGGRRRVRPVGPGAQARLRVSWLVLNGLLLLGGARRPQTGSADRRGGSGTNRWYRAFFCSGMAVLSPMTPPWGSGSPNRPAWARRTCIGDVLALTLCAGRTSGARLALVTFCWFLLRCVGAVGRADGSQVVGTYGVSRCGRFAGWTRPCGHVRETPVVCGNVSESTSVYPMRYALRILHRHHSREVKIPY